MVGMGDVYTLMGLSILRCIIMTEPTKASFISKKIVTLCLLTVFTLALTISLPPLLGFGDFVPEVHGLM